VQIRPFWILIIATVLYGATVLILNIFKTPIDWDIEFQSYPGLLRHYSYFADESCVGKCQWKRIDKDTLRFTGAIKEESFSEFQSKIDANVKTIEINSGGGKVSASLKIANEISTRKINVVVRGFCISSCANYIFLAGAKKTIDGIVGFHGSHMFAVQDGGECVDTLEKKGCEL